MALSINTNIAATNAYRNLSTTQNSLSSSLEKLSSGFRINRAADDAAGLAISEGLRAQVGGLTVAARNAQDGISVVQTAEGALNETHSILQRMRDLSVQAANDGALNDEAKGNIQTEIGQLQSELTRIADTTKFNGHSLLKDYEGTFQVGANVGEVINVKVNGNMDAAGLGVATLDVTTAAGSVKVGDALTVSGATAATAVVADTTALKALASTVEVNGTAIDLSAAGDAAGINAALTAAGVTGVTASWEAGQAITFTSTSHEASSLTVEVDGTAVGTAAGTSRVATEADVTLSGADQAITAIDAAIKQVSTVRSDLGAVQNRFDHTINNLNVASENLSASESRIRDTDMAQEMVSFTRSQILSQAGTSMLAQANQLPQGILSLLR